MPRKKFTMEQVRSLFESEGYTLLSTEYKNIFGELYVRCPKNHIYPSTYNTFRDGRRCPVCFRESKRASYEDVKVHLASKGCTLLSKTYTNQKETLVYKCPKGHKVEKSYHTFKNTNCVCMICKKEETRKRNGK